MPKRAYSPAIGTHALTSETAQRLCQFVEGEVSRATALQYAPCPGECDTAAREEPELIRDIDVLPGARREEPEQIT